MARRRLRARMNWAARWGGLALCLLIVVASVVTSYRRIAIVYESLPDRSATLQLSMGQIGLSSRWGPTLSNGPAVLRLECEEPDEPLLTCLLWTFKTTNLGRGQHWLYWRFPLWPLFIVAATAATTAMIRYRARRPGACPSCGYDLSGLPPGSPCPECATKHH